jgi:hypothetical protein
MAASAGGQVVHNEVGTVQPATWFKNQGSVWSAIGPNFASAFIQQVITGIGSHFTSSSHPGIFANGSDGVGGNAWPDAGGNGVGGTMSDWLYPWP